MSHTRRATIDDLDALIELIVEFYEIDGHPYDREHVVGALDALLRGDAFGQVWITDDIAEPIGYAIVTWGYCLESGGRDALLDEIYLRDRGRGLGTELLGHVLGAARAVGASRMFLETQAGNERARDFYARHGFVAEASVWMRRNL